jgi:hypothetical protein
MPLTLTLTLTLNLLLTLTLTPSEFLRKHGLNGSEELVLKKKNRAAVATAFYDWKKDCGAQVMRDDNIEVNTLTLGTLTIALIPNSSSNSSSNPNPKHNPRNTLNMLQLSMIALRSD